MAPSQKDKNDITYKQQKVLHVNNDVAPESLDIYYKTTKFCKHGIIHHMRI